MESLKNMRGKNIKRFSSVELRELQQLLNRWGYNLIVDGIYGNKTESAFLDFKRQNKLTEPFLFGKTTLEFLLKNPTKREVNKEGLELIKEFEGFRTNAYLCPANVWTIGYGNTFYDNGIKVKKGDRITEAEAERLLKITVESFADQVNKLISVPVTSNQFSALVSLAYNIGVGAFARSTLLKLLNQKLYDQSADQFMVWSRAGGRTLEGLRRRRSRERQLFLK
jgi:lysozyme